MAPTKPPTHNSVILVLFLDSIAKPSHTDRLVKSTIFATQRTTDHLRILVASPDFNPDTGLKPTHAWKEVQSLLTSLYAAATGVAQEADNVLMNIEVVFHGPGDQGDLRRHADIKWDALFISEADEASLTLGPLSSIQRAHIGSESQLATQSSTEHDGDASPPSDLPPTYPVVALGGTFDHIHPGHKILLSMSAWIASEKVIVGMTDDALLVKKSNREVLEPIGERTESVRQFLHLFKPQLELDTPPITDVYGPTAWDPNIQAIVVSKETLSGVQAIAKKREEESLPPLAPFVIEVISPNATLLASDDADYLKTAKMSSTFIRQWVVDKQRAAELVVAAPEATQPAEKTPVIPKEEPSAQPPPPQTNGSSQAQQTSTRRKRSPKCICF